MAFEVPHKHDISLDGQEMRNQMIENFEAIEHADEELEQRITKLEKIIFGQDPLEIKDTVPTKVESTAVEINDSLATQIFLE